MKKIELRSHRIFLENIIFLVSLLIAYILQTSCNFFNIFGVTPLIILAVMLSISMFYGVTTTCVYSFISGILCDICLDIPVGISCLIFVITFMTINMLTIYYFRINIVSFLLFMFILILIESLTVAIFRSSEASSFQMNVYVIKNIIPLIIVTEIMSIPIFLFFKFINKKVFLRSDIFYTK